MSNKRDKTPLKERYLREKDRLERLLKTEIWRASNLRERSRRASVFRLLRIFSIALSGLKETNIGSRAAALCFSSLLGIGPLIAVAVTVSGFVLERTDSDIALRTVNQAITFIAPQITIPEDSESGEPEEPTAAINPELAELIDEFISRAQSGTVGLAGMLLIVLVAIQLLTSVENAFNSVWGVKRGRSLVQRVVFYWTLISLGAVLGFAALGLFSLSFTDLMQQLPLGDHLLGFLQWLTPLFSLLLLTLLLTGLYRFMPNTHVAWRPALFGATIVAVLLMANNALTFLYVQRVVTTYSIYGSVGILPVIMLGLFVFWLIVLFGAQIIYAVQNVNHLSNQEAWKGISHSARELLSLVLLVRVGRRFVQCAPPFSSEELTSLAGAPSQIVNESLSRLVDLGYLAAIPETDGNAVAATRYQPARPLENISPASFRKDFEEYGNSDAIPLLDDLDPIIKRYREEARRTESGGLAARSLAELLARETRATEKPPRRGAKKN